MTMLMFRVLLLCALVGTGCALSCKWMEHKYREYRESSLNQLNLMANNSINSTDLEETVSFPNELYNQASKAVAGERLCFVVQLLEMIVALFDEDQTFAPWHEGTVDDFLNILTQQADGLRSCTACPNQKRKNKKLNMYFGRLTVHMLEQTGHSAEAWDWIRRQVKLHLQRSDQLVSSKTN